MTRGVVFVHSAPAALCPHVEWAVAGVLGSAQPAAAAGGGAVADRLSMAWTPQPAQPGTYRAEFSWSGEPGTASRIASALRGWEHLRFEVTEEPSPTAEGARFSGTPSLGIFHAVIGLHGDIMVPEDRLRAALLDSLGERDGDDDPRTAVQSAVQALLGKAWDDELEPFRHAGDGAPVRWLHHVV
jgi:hypothetical protein